MQRLMIQLVMLIGVPGISAVVLAHPGHEPSEQRTTEPSSSRPFLNRRDLTDEASAEDADRLSHALTQLAAGERFVSKNVSPPEIALPFEPFVKLDALRTRWDDRFFYVESNGIPDHRMMVGIKSWQQQVPIPQKYTGQNAWSIPLHPVPAKSPLSTKNRFLRGAIAMAVNGVPIFNPLNNRGDDAFLVGELDEFGGHCGRADDYHYHLPPVHLVKTVGRELPIAYALDGYPIFGYEEPDGSPVSNLDAFNGHTGNDGRYHYHATKAYPYLNGGFHGEVVERDGQVDPQPRAEPVRAALTPLHGATIVEFERTGTNRYRLVYVLRGKKGTVSYLLKADGSADFTFVDPDGKTRNETYAPRRDEDGGRRRRQSPPREKAPPAARNDQRSSSRETESARPVDRDDLPRLTVSSASVDERGRLNIDCTCDGAGKSPAVAWRDAPPGTRSFAVCLWHVAPDQKKSYWVVYNIPAHIGSLEQNAKGVGVLGLNDRGQAAYEPMCSKGPGRKTYHLTVYALSAEPKLVSGKATRSDLLDAIREITLATGTLDLQYERAARN